MGTCPGGIGAAGFQKPSLAACGAAEEGLGVLHNEKSWCIWGWGHAIIWPVIAESSFNLLSGSRGLSTGPGKMFGLVQQFPCDIMARPPSESSVSSTMKTADHPAMS